VPINGIPMTTPTPHFDAAYPSVAGASKPPTSANEKIPLKTGDCLYFNAEIPHMGKNVGRVDAKVLMVAAPGRGPGREYGWWKAPAPAARARPRRRSASRTRRDA